MTDRNLDDLHPALRPLCEQWLAKCKEQSINAVVYGTYRSDAEQAKDYAVGRDANGNIIGKILTKAKPGQSKHNFTIDGKPASKAFDWFIQDSDGTPNWNPRSVEWQTAVVIGKGLGLKWGGDFPRQFIDADHFEID
jgi:peptidoglycan LD-endopeptidase CwlK